MKILFTTDTIKRGGKERQLFILTSNLIQRGADIRIISLKFSDDNFLNEHNFDKNRIIIINKGNKLQQFVSFQKTVSDLKPDCTFSWDLQTSVYNLLIYKKYKYKFINGSIQHGIRLFRISHLIRTFICWISPFIVANSIAGLRANNLRPDNRRFVLYNGIEQKFINTLSKKESEVLRNELIPGYKENPGLVFVSVANLVPYKDFFTVFKALTRLRLQFKLYYLIIGDGPMRQKVEKKINFYSLEGNTFIIGKTNEVNKYLFASDIMIHSSRGEGISNAILEGMYAGLPIIATEVGGIPETVFPKSSILFRYKDNKALYNCLLRSREAFYDFNPQSSDYKKHLEKFSVNSMVNRFEEIIRIVFTRV